MTVRKNDIPKIANSIEDSNRAAKWLETLKRLWLGKKIIECNTTEEQQDLKEAIEWQNLQKQWWQERIPQWQENITTFNVCSYKLEEWQAVQDAIMPHVIPILNFSKEKIIEIADKIGEAILDYQCENLRQDRRNDFLRLKENKEERDKLEGYLEVFRRAQEFFTIYEGRDYIITEGMERSKRLQYCSTFHEMASKTEKHISNSLSREGGRPRNEARRILMNEISQIWQKYTRGKPTVSKSPKEFTKFSKAVCIPILVEKDKTGFNRALLQIREEQLAVQKELRRQKLEKSQKPPM